MVSRFSSGSSSPWLWLVPASSSRGQGQVSKVRDNMSPHDQWHPTHPLPAFFMDVFHASVVLPAHLIWSSPATVCLSLHTETMFGTDPTIFSGH